MPFFGETMSFVIRKMQPAEYAFLDDFLYEAIFIPEGEPAPPREVIHNPDLQVYVKDFGKLPDDICFVAETDGRIAGAVWTRVMDDYGHIEDGVPSFAISLYPEFRGFGMGTALMRRMIDELRERGYKKASLSVQKANYALKLYEKMGFDVLYDHGDEYIMVLELKNEENKA